MPVVSDKYRGTTTYFHVLAELGRAAQYRGRTTYQDIALLMGLPQSGNYMGKEVGLILGEISEDEVRAGRPMLSAVAVGVNGKAGSGFFGLARDLGRLDQNIRRVCFLEGGVGRCILSLAQAAAAVELRSLWRSHCGGSCCILLRSRFSATRASNPNAWCSRRSDRGL